MKKRRAEREAAKAAKKAMEGKPPPDGSEEDDAAKPTKADTGTRRRKRAKATRPKAEAGGPLFISLEGIDGSGKSTQATLLAEELGPETVFIREPGGTDAAERIRTLLADPGLELDPLAELLLFLAARADLTARVIRPALEAGRDVVSDRFADSSVAYQGAARGLGVGEVISLTDCRQRGPLARPDPAAEDRPRDSESSGPTAMTASSPRGSSCSAPSPRPTTRSPRSPPTGSS